MSAVRLTAPALLLVAGAGCRRPGGTSGPPCPPARRASDPGRLCPVRRPRRAPTARDVIVGRAGDDDINGRGGNDLICGGGDADELRGGLGDDSLRGGGDRLGSDVTGTFLVGDVLLGGPGDDKLVGGFDDRSAQTRRRPDTVSWVDSPRGVVVDLVAGTATGFGADTIPPSHEAARARVAVRRPDHRVDRPRCDRGRGGRRPDRGGRWGRHGLQRTRHDPRRDVRRRRRGRRRARPRPREQPGRPGPRAGRRGRRLRRGLQPRSDHRAGRAGQRLRRPAPRRRPRHADLRGDGRRRGLVLREATGGPFATRRGHPRPPHAAAPPRTSYRPPPGGSAATSSTA